ncbi:MAG: DUF2279 domain-containing protein [Bacteroidota bacterium]
MNHLITPARQLSLGIIAGLLLLMPAPAMAGQRVLASAPGSDTGLPGGHDSAGVAKADTISAVRPTPGDTLATLPDSSALKRPTLPDSSTAGSVGPGPSQSPDIPSLNDGTTDQLRLSPEEYTFAGHTRYTMNGKLPYRQTTIQPATMAAFGGALLALATTITWYQQAWYPDSTLQHFHFLVDWRYAKEFDKVGHAFGGWMSAYCSHEAFIASGLSRDDAAIWGAAGGLFFQTFMEVQDGFHSWGFDWTDELGNVIGAGYFYAQLKVPFLQNFDPKWSVGPTGRDSARNAAQIRSRLIVDDYDRQDMWLSVKVHNLLPENLKPYWPKWLQLAVGAGARDVELTGYTPYRVLHLSLDYNLVEMLPNLGSFGNWLVQGINAFHLPAPALQLWPKVKFELIYPFHL